MFERSWVCIPAPYTGGYVFTYICCKNCNVCLKRSKINEKEAGVGPFFLKKDVKILNILHRGWRKGNTETVGKYAQM